MNQIVKWTFFALLLASVIFIGGDTKFIAVSEAQDFDVCMEDDSDKASAVRFSSTSGDYQFCAGGNFFTGKGTITKQGNSVTLQHTAADRRVLVRVDNSTNNGSASIQAPAGKTVGTIRDSSTADSKCGCR